jgi:anti-sigma-K factor RskA
VTADPDDSDIPAGEYVLGVLSADDRGAVERRLQHDQPLADLALAWQERLAPLATDLTPIVPSPQVWLRLRRSVEGRARVRRSRWWNRVNVWRGLMAVATAAALAVLAIVLTSPPQRLMAVLNDAQGRPVWLLRTAEDDRGLVTRLLGDTPPAERVPELWLLPADGPPMSLGLLDISGDNRRPLAGDLGRQLDGTKDRGVGLQAVHSDPRDMQW